MTDGEPHIYCFGNPTRSTGKFYRITFGSEWQRWIHGFIDSRNCALPNKRQIPEWMRITLPEAQFAYQRSSKTPQCLGTSDPLGQIGGQKVRILNGCIVSGVGTFPLIWPYVNFDWAAQ